MTSMFGRTLRMGSNSCANCRAMLKPLPPSPSTPKSEELTLACWSASTTSTLRPAAATMPATADTMELFPTPPSDWRPAEFVMFLMSSPCRKYCISARVKCSDTALSSTCRKNRRRTVSTAGRKAVNTDRCSASHMAMCSG